VRRFALSGLATVLLAALLVPPTAHANRDTRIVSGWIPYWMSSPARPAGINATVANADLFIDVSPFWYSARRQASGGVRIVTNPNFGNAASNISWAMAQLRTTGVAILPAIADGSGKGRMAATLANPTLRTQHVQQIVDLVVSNGFDGIDLDYEVFAFQDGSASWAATQPNWTAFVQELGAALQAQRKQLAVTVPPPCNRSGVCGPKSGYWVYNVTGIAPFVDRIRIMAYDYNVSSIGPIAPIDWVRSIVQYMASAVPPEKVQIGVPTYGRTWTLRQPGGGFQLSGNCPANSGSQGERDAYRSLTAPASATDADIPGILAAPGARASQIRWDERYQESSVDYDKVVRWTDAAGAQQTCTARRTMWFVGPEAVLARTRLVGEFGINAAAMWTVGGEDPAQWPLLRQYAQSLAPATSQAVLTAPTNATFGLPISMSAVININGAPAAQVPVQLQFRQGSDWVAVQDGVTGADGAVAFAPNAAASGRWRVLVPAAENRPESISEVVDVQVGARVMIRKVPKSVRMGQNAVVVARVLPAQQGQRVRLEVRRGDRWQRIAVGNANARGRVRLVAPRLRTTEVYRVRSIARGGIAPGISSEFRVRVR
jgi:spore germination protein YaaH/5-hydroxyisourate hydrolase-like protein (transthyretin family)